MMAVVHGVVFGLALDALCARARSRPMSESRSEADIGPEADLARGMPAGAETRRE